MAVSKLGNSTWNLYHSIANKKTVYDVQFSAVEGCDLSGKSTFLQKLTAVCLDPQNKYNSSNSSTTYYNGFKKLDAQRRVDSAVAITKAPNRNGFSYPLIAGFLKGLMTIEESDKRIEIFLKNQLTNTIDIKYLKHRPAHLDPSVKSKKMYYLSDRSWVSTIAYELRELNLMDDTEDCKKKKRKFIDNFLLLAKGIYEIPPIDKVLLVTATEEQLQSRREKKIKATKRHDLYDIVQVKDLLALQLLYLEILPILKEEGMIKDYKIHNSYTLRDTKYVSGNDKEALRYLIDEL